MFSAICQSKEVFYGSAFDDSFMSDIFFNEELVTCETKALNHFSQYKITAFAYNLNFNGRGVKMRCHKQNFAFKVF